MDTSLKRIGERLRQIFGDPLRRPAGWNIIDAFTRLEEREEALLDADRDEYDAREAILKLLSDAEVAKVSTAEASVLSEGQEFVDLEHPERGAQRTQATTTSKIGQVLPRTAVSDETWRKVLSQLESL